VFENYVHTKEDLEAIGEALEYLERPELDFIFRDRSLIKNTLVISFDSRELFIWTKLGTSKLDKMLCQVKGWNAYRTGHQIEFSDKDQVGWRAGIKIEKILEYLPPEFDKSDFEIPKINGSLLTPFIGIHKKQRETNLRPQDPYYTYESYLATIIHEFGHVYFNQHKLWFYGSKEETLNYISLARGLYQGEAVSGKVFLPLRFPIDRKLISEVFAFCTDYSAAKMFWPRHIREINKENEKKLKWFAEEEKGRDLDCQDSILIEDPHNAAAVLGKILLEVYPRSWPDLLLKLGRI